MMNAGGYPLIDHGTAPRYYVSRLGLIVPMGPVAQFSFVVDQPQQQQRVVEVHLIAPVEAVGPAFELAVDTLGAKAISNLAGQAVGHLLGNAVARAARKWVM